MSGKAWAMALLPLALLAGLLAWIVRSGPTEAFREGVPPVEVLAISRAVLAEGEIRLSVLNDGPDPVTIAQVQVDEAYWAFTQEPPGELGRLGRKEIRLSYPWVHGETHRVKLVTSTGLTFEHEIRVAVPTPRPSARFFGIFALIGLYVGVIPVVLGLLWYPFAGRLGSKAMDFLLALTLGLLLFLLLDALHEGAEIGRSLPGTYQSMALLAFGVGVAYLALEGLGAWLKRRRSDFSAALVTALLVAVGIGLHNFGEGLAIGAAFALGEAGLGTLLVVGFTLHNTTEGLAIVAPLSRERVPWTRLLVLGLIAGLPTIAGAWLGGFVYSPLFSVLFLGLGAGAIAQVVLQIGRGSANDRPISSYLASAPVASGILAGFVLMYVTGMLVQ